MSAHRDLTQDFEQLVEEWFEAEQYEVDREQTTREERIGCMIFNYLCEEHPDDYPDRVKEVIRVLRTWTELSA